MNVFKLAFLATLFFRLLLHSVHGFGQAGTQGLITQPTHYRSLPPIVPQITNDLCWAASMESWLKITSGRKKYTRDELPGKFTECLKQIMVNGEPKNHLDADNFDLHRVG